MFAKHGFQNLAERIKLGRYVLKRFSISEEEADRYSVAERVRMSFEELGPTFVKLGQLLASRPDLVPQDFVEEFERLHAEVQPVPVQQILQVVEMELGCPISEVFSEFHEAPLGSASIAQVHSARLKTGEHVVVKVQRPGLLNYIKDDLSVLFLLAELLNKYVPEIRHYNLRGIVQEFFKSLQLETDFIVEANNIRRFRQNFAHDPNIKIPQVYLGLSTEKMLVMEALDGQPLSAIKEFGSDFDSEEIIRRGLRAYLKMVFNDGLFHGDLHAGNFFILPDNRVGLVDFGLVGRLNRHTQNAIASMLISLANEDYERLAYEYVDLAPFDERTDVDLFAKDLQDLIAPYHGLTLKKLNLGRILMMSSSVASKHHLVVPTELMLYFKSIVSIEGLGKRIAEDFDFLTYATEFAAELVKQRFEPAHIAKDMTSVVRDVTSLATFLPRQLKFMIKKINSPDYAVKHQVEGLKDLRKSVETSSNILFLGLIIGSLIFSGSYVLVNGGGPTFWGMPLMAVVGYGLAAALGLVAFSNYIKK